MHTLETRKSHFFYLIWSWSGICAKEPSDRSLHPHILSEAPEKKESTINQVMFCFISCSYLKILTSETCYASLVLVC